MKKYILSSIFSILILTGLIVMNEPPKAWSDAASNNTAAVSQNFWDTFYSCTNGAGGLPIVGTCVPVNVNWTSLVNYMGANVNWQDLPGVTGAVYSTSTFIKSTAP